MSEYNHTVCFKISVSQVENAKRISRSLDSDIGGYEAFQLFASANGLEPATHAMYHVLVKDGFIETLNVLAADATLLKATVDADYAARWPNEVPPTLAECTTLLTNLQIFIDKSWDEVLPETKLTRIIL